MSKQSNVENRKPRIQSFVGESGGFDKGALACDVIMLAIFLWIQTVYQMDMLFLIIPLVLLGVYLVLFGVLPETYMFTEDSLEVQHKFQKTIRISYDSVFNYDESVKDSFINIFQSNRVKVYYMIGRKKKVILCTPKDVSSFVETLKWNCPEFYDNLKEKSSLEVFFKKEK